MAATFTVSLGRRRRIHGTLTSASLKSAIHFQHPFDPLARLKRAFSASLHGELNSWGDVPGSGETAPLALNRYRSPPAAKSQLLLLSLSYLPAFASFAG